jgi:SAM-dependent methyltransferase
MDDADKEARQALWARKAAAFAEASNWKAYHAHTAMGWFDPQGLDVLVVGCALGEDCIPFVDNGAASVTGLDHRDNIGVDFAHPRVSYVRHTAEQMPLPSGRFDLVYSLATLEHIDGLEETCREMARVLAPGGGLYCVSAPLWHTREGPHWGEAMNDVPWAHLRFPPDEVIRMAEARGVEKELARLLMHVACNKRRARDYVDAFAGLGLEVIRNEIGLETEAEPEIAAELYAKGYTRDDLFGMSHTFIGTKPG